MAQVVLDLDLETATKMQQSAEREGLSQSEWVTRLIKARLASAWPDSVKQLAGAWPDFPDAETLRQNNGKDILRETL